MSLDFVERGRKLLFACSQSNPPLQTKEESALVGNPEKSKVLTRFNKYSSNYWIRSCERALLGDLRIEVGCTPFESIGYKMVDSEGIKLL